MSWMSRIANALRPGHAAVDLADELQFHLDQRAADLQVQMGFVPCIGNKCALWNDEQLECLDVTKRKADARVPELLEQIDGFMRLHSSESGG